MLLYGTLTGRPFPALYGATRLALPELVKSPLFQQMAMEQGGIRPGTWQAVALGTGLATLGAMLSQSQPPQKAPVSANASIADQLRARGIKIVLKGTSRTTLLQALENVDPQLVAAKITKLLQSKREIIWLQTLNFIYDRMLGKPKARWPVRSGLP